MYTQASTYGNPILFFVKPIQKQESASDFLANGYRFGFNGQEKDNEVGAGIYTAQFWEYDSRIGRRWNVDPEFKKGPEFSPYSTFLNNPILNIDNDGDWAIWVHYRMTKRALIELGTDRKTAKQIAYYASTYADHPNFLVRTVAKIVGIAGGINPARFSSNEKEYQNSETKDNQSDKGAGVAVHAMKAYFEDITDEEAIDRAMWGGTFEGKDGNTVEIEGAMNVVNRLGGGDYSKLTTAEKKELGVAIHTVQDVTAHEGGKWAEGRDHKREAAEKGDPKRHNIWRDMFGGKGGLKQAKSDTKNLLK